MLRIEKKIRIVPLAQALEALFDAGVPGELRRHLTVRVRLDGVPFVSWEEVLGIAAAWSVRDAVEERLRPHVLIIDEVAYELMRLKESVVVHSAATPYFTRDHDFQAWLEGAW